MEEKDYALISDRELVDRLLIGDEEIVRYLFLINVRRCSIIYCIGFVLVNSIKTS